MSDSGHFAIEIKNRDVLQTQSSNIDLPQGMTTLSTTMSETTAVMVNENRKIFNAGNISNDNLNDGNVSKLIDEPSISVTKELFLCRICYNYDHIERFISPCLCKGSLYFVHKQCLEQWLSRAGILHCELCMYRFRTECTLRYGCCEAIRLWYRHPNHRGLMQSDAMLCSTLTLIILGLLAIVCFGLDYFIPEGQENAYSDQWMRGTTIALLIVSVVAYLLFVTFMIRQQLCPWYRWKFVSCLQNGLIAAGFMVSVTSTLASWNYT